MMQPAPGAALVVEDEVLTGWDLCAMLEDMGFEPCELVATGQAAIRMCQSIHPALIVMDIRLKGPMDGLTAAREIRQECDVPIIFASAHIDADLRAELQELSDEVLDKPVLKERLTGAVCQALGGS